MKNRIWDSKIATENHSLYLEYRTHSFPWRENSTKLEDARFGRQFSRSEMEQLLIFRQAPLPISISTAICDTADALHVSAKPEINVAPIINPYDDSKSTTSREVAGLYKHLIQKAWYDALGGLQYDKAVFDRTTVGHGLLYAVPRMEFGEFKVDIKNISWKYFYPDPSCTDPLYTDADAMIYAVPISIMNGFKFVHSMEPDVSFDEFKKDFAKGASVSSAFFEEDPVYRRPMQSQNYLHFIQRLVIEDDYSYLIVPKSDDIGKVGLTYRTSTMMTDDLKRREANGEIKVIRRRELFLAEYTSIGNYGYKIVYPIRNYNIVPLQHDHRGTPYPYSLMWYLYPLQRALNKFIMSSILNMSLLNTTKVMAEENSIIDMNEWTTSASQPNAILRYRLPVPGYSTPPQIIPAVPMDSAYLVMPQYLTKMMEYISGFFGIMQGNPENSPDTFATVASLQSVGGQKVKRRQALADASLSQLGKVVGEFYKEYAPMNGYSSTYDPTTGAEDIVKYNELQSSVSPAKNGEAPKVSVTVNPSNDLRKGFRDVRFVSTGSMGYESATEAAMLTTLATQLSIPDLIPAILERINIPGLEGVRESIINRTDLTNKVEQLTKITDGLEREVGKKNNQIVQLSVGIKAAEAKGRMDVELTKLKTNPEGYIKSALNNQGAR